MAKKYFIKEDGKQLQRDIADIKGHLQKVEVRGSQVLQRPEEQRTATFSVPEPVMDDVFEEETCHIPRPTFGSTDLKSVETYESGKRRRKKAKEIEDDPQI